jgi:hypothetical protein
MFSSDCIQPPVLLMARWLKTTAAGGLSCQWSRPKRHADGGNSET